MKCECSGDTVVLDTRTIDGIFRRKRKCNTCGEIFFTKEEFLYKAEDNPNFERFIKPKPKGVFTKPQAVAIKMKKVEARRKVEDIKQERKFRVPSYFIEEEDY